MAFVAAGEEDNFNDDDDGFVMEDDLGPDESDRVSGCTNRSLNSTKVDP